MTPDFNDREDPLAACKGIVWAIPFSLALWAAAVLAALGVAS